MQHITIIPLGDSADILPGLSTGGRLEHSASGTHQVVQSRHLTPGLPYAYTPADEFRITPGRGADRYEIRLGDVLFMSRGTRNVATRVESVPRPTVAPVSFFILRPGPGLDADYLTWYLNQPRAQRVISDIRTGAGTPIVQRAPFSQMTIPVPDMERQHIIGQIGAAMARERTTREHLAEAVSQFHNAISEQIARELFAHAETSNAE